MISEIPVKLYTVICDSKKTRGLYLQLISQCGVSPVKVDDLRVSVNHENKDRIVEYHNKNKIGVLTDVSSN